MTPAIIAHYLVAIAVIAVFLTIALIREALLREAADRRRDEEFDRIRAAERTAARRRTDALYLDFARRAGAAVELPADWDRLAMCAAALAVAALTAGAAASSVDLTAGAYAVAVVKLAAGCALSALFASLSGALFDAAEG